MGTVTITGAIIIIISWITLIEYDSFPESERKQIIQRIKGSTPYILLIALMPIGILINVLGGFFRLDWMSIVGTSFMLLQGIIVSFLFWNKKRWKSILLLATIVPLGMFIYMPLFFR